MPHSFTYFGITTIIHSRRFPALFIGLIGIYSVVAVSTDPMQARSAEYVLRAPHQKGVGAGTVKREMPEWQRVLVDLGQNAEAQVPGAN